VENIKAKSSDRLWFADQWELPPEHSSHKKVEAIDVEVKSSAPDRVVSRNGWMASVVKR
jgi:hypothetical protein